MSNELLDKVREWKPKLQTCQFVGELYLDTKELCYLLRIFGKYGQNGLKNKEDYDIAAVILAVNCAYHHYDDDGFWAHFSRLMGRNLNLEDKDRIGQRIENGLMRYGLLKTERTGPFRYVGSILEQSGISKRYIPAFAKLIKDLKSKRTWDSLISIDFGQLNWYLETNSCSLYLKRYLQDTAGWKHLRQVAGLLKLFEQGNVKLAELKELSGYQPDFWDSLLSEFNFQLSSGKNNHLVGLKPKIYFSPADRTVNMRFPSEKYLTGIVHPSGKSFWSYPVTVLNDAERFFEYYSGVLSRVSGEEETWWIQGWKPDGEPAIFDIRYGFIPFGKSLRPGEYYLVATNGYVPECTIIEDYGQANILADQVYKAYRVVLGQGDRVAGYKIIENDEYDIALSWVEPEKYQNHYLDTTIDVFIGRMPTVSVSNFELVQSGKVGLFYNTGKRTGRIKSEEDLGRLLKEAAADAPISGSIYMVTTGRTAYDIDPRCQILEFYLLPKFELSVQTSNFSFDAEPIVNLITDGRVKLHLQDCRESQDGNWIIPARLDIASGFITCGEHPFDVRIPVYRSRMYDGTGKAVRFLYRDTQYGEGYFLLTGLPGLSAELSTFERSRGQKIEFDNLGRCLLENKLLHEIVKTTKYLADELILRYKGGEAKLGVTLLDVDSIKLVIYEGYSDPIFPQEMSGSVIAGIIGLCRDICSKARTGIKLKSLPHIPVVNEWLSSLLACAQIFDSSEIVVNGKADDFALQLDGSELSKILKAYVRLRDDGIAPTGTMDFSHLPKVTRWLNCAEKLLGQFTSQGIDYLLNEWSQEVRTGHGAFKSRIARLPGGGMLSTAWRMYCGGDFRAALNTASNLRSGSEIVNSLKICLVTISMLRLGRLDEAKDLWEKEQFSGIMDEPLKGLATLLSAFNGDYDGLNAESVNKLARFLPLTENDNNLIALFSHSPTYNTNIEQVNQDWLSIWLAFRMANPENKPVAAEYLLKNRALIPNFPAREQIIDLLVKAKEGQHE